MGSGGRGVATEKPLRKGEGGRVLQSPWSVSFAPAIAFASIGRCRQAVLGSGEAAKVTGGWWQRRAVGTTHGPAVVGEVGRSDVSKRGPGGKVRCPGSSRQRDARLTPKGFKFH